MLSIAKVSCSQSIASTLCTLLLALLPVHRATAAPDPGDVYKGAYWLLQQADAAREAGQVEDARKSYTSALDVYKTISIKFPSWEKDLVQFRMSYCREQLEALGKDATGAIVEDTLPESTADPDAQLAEARELCVKGSAEQAASILADLIRMDPTNRIPRELMGIAQCQMGHYADAISLLGALAGEPKPSLETLLALAAADCGAGHWKDAKLVLDNALLLEPNTPAIHFDLAQLYLNATPPDLESASAAYLKFLSLGGQHDPTMEHHLQR